MCHAGTQQLGTQNPGTQLLKALGTIRFGLGTQGKQAYKPGKRDPNVVRQPFAQHRLKAHVCTMACSCISKDVSARQLAFGYCDFGAAAPCA